MNYLDEFRAARRAGVPIVMIRTADFQPVIKDVGTIYQTDKEVGLLKWDACQGVSGINDNGVAAALKVNDGKNPQIATANGVEALKKTLAAMPNNCVLFMMNLQIVLESRDPGRLLITQAIWNCRDQFKSSQRTLVLLVPDMKLPAELANDVITIEMPLPTTEELAGVVKDIYKSAELKAPEKDVLDRAIDAVSGLSTFSAEQVTAMAIGRNGVDPLKMWARKKEIIRQVGGLTVHDKTATFDAIGGNKNVKAYLRQIINGKRRPKLVVLVDEIEKQMGGLNDSSGVGMDAFGVILSAMQDYGWGGVLFPGFPGTAKTQLGKAMGTEAGGLFLTLDLGGMKDKFVGNSEKQVRAAMAMLKAMGGPNVFFIGTCNSMSILKPELKRRFSYGTFFFDLPPSSTRDVIWKIYLEKFQIEKQPMPRSEGWTGAEIEACCQRADELGILLIEAAKFITPVVMSMGDGVGELRDSAHQKYLSAENPGFYDKTAPETDTAIDTIRKIQLEGK